MIPLPNQSKKVFMGIQRIRASTDTYICFTTQPGFHIKPTVKNALSLETQTHCLQQNHPLPILPQSTKTDAFVHFKETGKPMKASRIKNRTRRNPNRNPSP